MSIRPRLRALAIPALAMLAFGPLAACGAKPDAAAESAAVTPQNLTLTADQLQHVRVVEVTEAEFHTAAEVSGVVDFDNDQSTSVTSPISGLVTRLLVQPGQQVAAGQALAMVDSPDFAAATSAYAKALATARTTRRIADADRDLAQHNGVSAREAQQAETDAANAAADRDAALLALQGLKLDPKAIKEIEAHVDSELRGARQEEAHAEKRFEEAQARKTKISEGVGEELRRLEERKSALHAAAEQRMEVLKPRFHEVRAALNAARLAVKEKERRVEKVRHAFAQCRHDIETIALEHRAHASHAAALSAAHEAARASEKAKRRAGIF